MGKVIHIQTAGCDISGYKQLDIAETEPLHHGITLCLRKVPVQGIGIVSLLHQLFGYLLRFLAGAAEDDGIYSRIVVHYPFQSLVFVLGMHHIDHMAHIGRAFVLAAYGDFLRITEIILCYL